MLGINSKRGKIYTNKELNENSCEFAALVGVMCELYGIEKIKQIFEIGLEVYEEEGSVLTKRKRKIQEYEINAKSRKDLITQIKALELPKHVEKTILKDIIVYK